MNKAYSIEEACQYMSIKKTMFYSLLNQNKIRARKIGSRKTIVLQSDLDSFLESLEDYQGGTYNE